MSAAFTRRRAKRPADDAKEAHPHPLPPSSSTSSQWIHSIQNESFQPKPTAYLPHSLDDEDPLVLQQRQCREKLQALRQVRARIRFYPVLDTQRGSSESTCYSMKISTSMILSGEDKTLDWQNDCASYQNIHENVGIDALGSLEMLLFGFFSRQELLRVSGVCTAWRALARDDLFWEPLLLTSLEKYPLRPLLGLERDPTKQHDAVPAILVYMVYKRLRMAQTAYSSKCSDDAVTARMNAVATRSNGRFVELFQTLNGPRQIGALSGTRWISQEEGEAVSSVHLVSAKVKSTVSTLGTREDHEVTQMAAELHLQAQGGDATAGVPNGAIMAIGEQAPVVGNARDGVGAADDEDVYSVADGKDRVTLSAWFSTKKRVNERTLRSFLRQMLLAVNTLEQSNCEHVDISPVNIVVHCPSRMNASSLQNATTCADIQVEPDESEEEEEDETKEVKAVHGSEGMRLEDNRQCSRRQTPFFQLFISRRNCQYTGGARGRAFEAALAVDPERNIPAAVEVNGGIREIAQQHQILAEAEAVPNAGAVNVGNHGVMDAAFRNQLALPRPSMVSSVIQIAMTVWARGRFSDANAATVLAQLLRFPTSFSSSLRSFLEYAKYLLITHSATASKLLRHDYLQCPEARLAHHASPCWSTTSINDVNEYKRKLVAYYGSVPFRTEALFDKSSSIGPIVLAELMPRTNLGIQYFSKALEEANLPAERFVSVVAPSTVSSSWVRNLACTQTCTLQRLDLSLVRVPMSVLLRELATLPRLTHLRLPRQILRDENLEHLVAALAYADLLPHLQGLDDNIRQAMDRMEKSYLMQLDMVTFLLQKPNASYSAAAGHTTT